MINLKKSKVVLASIISGMIFSSVVFASDETKAPVEEPTKNVEIIYSNKIPDIDLGSDDITDIKEDSYKYKSEENVKETKIYSYLEITANRLNIRTTPGLEHEPVGQYVKGDMVIAHAKTDNGWYKLSSGYYIRDKYAKVRDDIETYEEFVEVREKLKEERNKIKEKTNADKIAVSGTGNVYGSIKLTSSEREYLARLIKCEAGGESFEGQVAVAKVVFNRMLSDKFPNTLTEVVNAKNQFTPVMTGKINRVKASQTQYDAIDAALASSDNLNGALYFYAPGLVKSEWFESLQTVAVIGTHHFKID